MGSVCYAAIGAEGKVRKGDETVFGEGCLDQEVREGLSKEVIFMVKFEGQEGAGHVTITPKQTIAFQTENSVDAKA